jgi:ABC-type multidrug transport system fused ATPase/permease subunit
LRSVFKDVTAVVIAHRLSTIKEMGRIVVLDEGRIVEEGSFDELIERRGTFYDLSEAVMLDDS